MAKLRRQIRLGRWLIIALAVTLAAGSAGVAYASMRGGAENKGVVASSTCCCGPFTWVVSNDDGTEDAVSPYGSIDPGDDGGGTNYDRWGPRSSDDPSEPQAAGLECARYDKDVARTTAWISEENNEITVVIENGYPCYHATVFFGLRCPDSALGTITEIIIDNPYPEAISVTTSGISVGQPLPQDEEVVAAVRVHIEQPASQNAVYTFRISIAIQCASPTCGTAYAYHADYATCFLDLGFSSWGWTNGPLTAGYYEFQLWASAAGCDTSKGRLVGWLAVDYDGSTAVVTYNMYEGNWMTATQLYVGSERLPRDRKGKETVSPGQYPYKHDALDSVMTDSYTVAGLSGDIYIVAHAVTCWFE